MEDYIRGIERFLTPARLGLVLGGLLVVGTVFLVSCSEIVGPDNSTAEVQSSTEESSEQVTEMKSDSDTRVFVVVEDMPELVGGIAALQQEVRYPEQARRAGVEGTVVVQFIVDKQGNVVEPTVLRGIGAGCDEEAIRVVEQAQFEPGRQRGERVRVKMSLPVRYSLGE